MTNPITTNPTTNKIFNPGPTINRPGRPKEDGFEEVALNDSQSNSVRAAAASPFIAIWGLWGKVSDRIGAALGGR